MILRTLKNVMELNFLFFGWDKQFLTGSITQIYGSDFLYKLYMAGGFIAMAAIPVALAFLGLVGIIKAFEKLIPCLKNRFTAAFEKAVCFNMILRAVMISFLPLCVAAEFGALFSAKTEEMAEMNIGLVFYISLVLTASLAFFYFMSESYLEYKPCQ